MRPEQFRAVEQTKNILIRHSKKNLVAHQSSCGMQKCVSGKHLPVISWQKKMGLSRILILTFKPAVESAWREDLISHIDFEGVAVHIQ